MTLNQVTVAPTPDLRDVLPNANFVDAFETVLPSRESADLLTTRIMTKSPKWINHLLDLRNLVMAPFGLVTKEVDLPHGQSRLGMFPVISSNQNRTILGFDDRHLDFRIVIDALPKGENDTRLRLATAVRTHNIFGRIYLAIVLPFHRLIVPAMLRRAKGT